MGKVRGFRFELSRWLAVARHRTRVLSQGCCWQDARSAFTNLIFPPHCLLCSAELEASSSNFCPQCYGELTSPHAVHCPRCARPVPQHTRADAAGCLLCAEKKLWFHRAVALGVYGGTLRELVLRMKSANSEPLTLAVGQLLAERVLSATAADSPELVAPVPMHWLRRLTRGVNDAELLAEAIASRLKIPVGLNQVGCRRRTRKQGTLTRAERSSNVRGAYAVRCAKKVRDSHVLLVDDVMTTGATATEIARILRRAGARMVTVAVVARGVGFN